MADSIENILLNLLQNTTNEGQVQGFQEIKALFKDPMVNVSLCKCVTQSQDPQVRRYAALLLRRRLLKAKQWRKIPPDVKQGLKQTILQAYIKDNEKIVRNAVAELIGAVAKHELSDGKWPELMELLNQCIRSNNVTDREVGLYSLSVITKALGQKLKPHFKGLLSLFQNTLTDRSSIEIPFYTIKALTNMVCSIGTEEMNLFQALVPSVIMMIKLLAADDQEKACESMEIFDELVESEVAVLAPHMKSLIELCLEISSSEKLDSELRIKAVNIVAYLIRLKKKAIIKQKLAQPILDVFFPLMCLPSPADEDDDDEDELELSLPSAAGQALDVMALHLPPAKFIPLLMHHLEPALQNPDPHHKKAAYLAISVIAEGCSEFIRYKYLQNFVQVICRGIKDENGIVRNAAMYAVGQYAEYLQPDISKYASDLLPVLFEHLDRACTSLKEGNKDSSNLRKTFYAVERFCENLEDIVPFLPKLMCCLTTFLDIQNESSVTAQELAIEAIGSVAAAAKEHFVPYFAPVVEVLKNFISQAQTDATRPIQIESIDTLAIIARSVGAEVFFPIAHDCVKCGLQLMQENDDPDIRRSCYNLFASAAVVLKADMAPYLSTIVKLMHLTLKSSDGISVNTCYGDGNTAFTLFEDDDEEEDANGQMNDDNFLNLDEKEEDEDDDDDITGYSVENAYMEEKEGACLALKEMSEEIGLMFGPFIEESFEEVRKLTESPSDDLRRASIGCLTQFCITLNQIHEQTGNLECRVALEQKLAALMPKMYSLAREDTEQTVVISCLENLQLLVDKVKQNALYGGNVDSISSLIKDVFRNKLACQDEDGGEDDQEAEYDSMVMEFAGELIASLVKVVSWQTFAPYLAGLMPLLLARTKKACTISEKSFAVGTLADIVSSMEPGSVQPFLVHLQPVFLGGMKDENEEVRSNAVYGLGVLIQNAGALVFDQYSLYLQALSNMIVSEQDPRTRDNICGAVARLIKSNPTAVPLKQVFPILIQSLPLREDLEENSTVFECLSFLHSIRAEEFFQNLPHVVKVLCEALSSNKLNESTVATVSSLLKNLCSEFPQEMDSLRNSFPQESIEIIEKIKAL